MAEPALKIVENDTPHIPNSLDLTEEEKRALLVNSLVKIEGLTEQKNTLVANIRTERKRLVANGFAPKVIDFALRLRKDEEADTIELHRAQMQVAQFLNHPIGTQPDLFDGQPDRTPEDDKAFAKGEKAGAEGTTCSPPDYAIGSILGQQWVRGWHKGQDTLASAFKKLEAKEVAEAESDEDDESED